MSRLAGVISGRTNRGECALPSLLRLGLVEVGVLDRSCRIFRPYYQVGLLIILLMPVCYREVHSFVIYTNISQRHVVVKGGRVSLVKALGHN